LICISSWKGALSGAPFLFAVALLHKRQKSPDQLWHCFQIADNLPKNPEGGVDMSETATTKKPVPAKKPAAPKTAPKAAPKAKPAASAPEPKPAAAAPVAEKAKGATLKMKDLVAQVTAASGGKKKGVKEIVEATLAALGDALSKGEAINLPGFGRAKVAHAEDKGAGKPMTIKLKSQAAGAAKKPKKEALAEDDE
jgi:nucleoid DNA-binding protein